MTTCRASETRAGTPHARATGGAEDVRTDVRKNAAFPSPGERRGDAGGRARFLERLARRGVGAGGEPEESATRQEHAASGPLARFSVAEVTPVRHVEPPWSVEAAARLDRLTVGSTRDGHAEARLSIGQGVLAGSEVRLVAGPHGLEATFLVASDLARGAFLAEIEALRVALGRRGVAVARLEVEAEGQGRRRQQEDEGRQGQRRGR